MPGSQLSLGAGGGLPSFRTQYSQSTIKAGDTLTAATINTTETLFASGFTVVGGSLAVGQIWRLWATGRFTCSAVTPPTQRLKLKIGSVVLLDTSALGLLAAATNARWRIDARLTVRAIGASGSIEAYGDAQFATGLTGVLSVPLGPSGAQAESSNPVTVDTTTDQRLALSLQFSGNAVGNTADVRQLVIDMAPPSSASD